MIEKLVQTLQEASKAYYEGNAIMSDAEYDILEEKLRKLDPENAWFSKVRESSASFYGIKRKHVYKFIGSVDKIHAVDESRFEKRDLPNGLTTSAKLDGTSMTVYFRDGKLQYAVTRGNGEEGFDITDKYLAITKKYNINIPKGLTITIRGEVVMGNQAWVKYKHIHPEASMQRNTGTGIINRKEVTSDLEYLDFVIYEIVATSEPEKIVKSELETLEKYNFGYPIAPFIRSAYIPADVILNDLRETFSQEWPLDGVVFNEFQGIERVVDGVSVIASEKEAYKFEDTEKETTVERIEWTLQKSGKLIPVVIVEPVEIEGATIRRASGFNAQFIYANSLDKGSRITIARSNLVIPDIREVLSESKDFSLPEVCPHCGSKLEWKGVHLVCKSEMCPQKQRLLIDHFLRVCGGDVRGASDVIYGQLDKGLYNSTFFYLRNTDFKEFTGHQRKLIQTICDNIFHNIRYDTLLKGVALEGIGDGAISRICKDRESVEKYFEGEDVTFSVKLTPSILESLKEGQDRAVRLKAELDWAMIPVSWGEDKPQEKEDTSNFRVYAVTGSLSVPRKAFETLLKAHGWIMGPVKKAECLITDDPNSGSAKNKEAKSLGKRVISEEEFRKEFL